jgi:SAM-dependent methyltransferase
MHEDYDGLTGTIGVVLARFRDTKKRKGLLSAVWMIVSLFTNVLITPFYMFTMGRKTFSFLGKDLRYFCHWYNTTFLNERAIEVAVAIEALKNDEGKSVLEIGNVLSHYTNYSREVLDKYEKGDGVINEDVVDFQPNKKYDLIVSLSTMEHVGFDEVPKDPKKFDQAVRHLKTLLAPGGKMLVTIPIDYNDNAVRSVTDGSLFDHLYYFSHDSRFTWNEVDLQKALTKKFFSPYQFANSVIVCLSGDWS